MIEDYSNIDLNVDEHYLYAVLLSEVIVRILKRKAKIKLSEKAIIKEKDIIDFMRRMRVSSLEKFNDTTYLGTVNFYRNSQDMEKNNTLGVIVLYMEGQYLGKLSKKLGYALDDDQDPELLAIACGTICNLVAGNFKSGMCQLGYKEMDMSHFSSYRNEILGGVEYPLSEKKKHELCFYVEGVKRIYADIAMGNVPKK